MAMASMGRLSLTPVGAAHGHASHDTRTVANISVNELRTLIRQDVQAVVRAELSGVTLQGPAGANRQGLQRQRAGDPAMARGDLPMGSGSRPPLEPESPGGSAALGAASKETVPLLESSISRKLASGFQHGELFDRDAKETFEGVAESVCPQMGACARKVFRWLDALWDLREPPRKSLFAKFVHGGLFQAFFACVVAANAAVMVYNANRDVEQFLSGEVESRPPWLKKADAFFLVCYCIEVCCKLIVHRLFYFWNDDIVWNWLDFAITVEGLLVQFSLGKGRGVAWLRTVRLFRFAKVLRILKVIKSFAQLNMIMKAIVGSFLKMFWSLVVFGLIFLIFALYFVSSVAEYLEQLHPKDREDLEETEDFEALIESFGSVQVCMRTLFMAISGGNDWAEFYEPLMPVSFASTVFLFFVAFGLIALLNIVTGIFVDQALKLSEPEVTEKAEEEFEQEVSYAKGLKKLLLPYDHEKNRRLSRDEFQEILEDGKLANYFRFLGIDPAWSKQHLPSMFDKIAEEEQLTRGKRRQVTEIRAHTLIERCMALRGNARSTEIMDLHDMVIAVQSTQQQILDYLQGSPQGEPASPTMPGQDHVAKSTKLIARNRNLPEPFESSESDESSEPSD